MKPSPVTHFDPLLGGDLAAAMVRLCERYGAYGMYGEEPIREGLGTGLAQRHDAALNFLRTGGRLGRREDPAVLAARTNYFREEYFYGQKLVDGIEPFLHHGGMIEAARALFDRPVVEPNIVFANLLVPGQELAVHTDVPEFRGANRKRDPQWLLVAMHHSGLFERWRVPIATCVSWYHDARGGEFTFYPEGPEGPPKSLPVRFDTAVLLDTDSTFHGVDRVADGGEPLPPLRPGMKLRHAGGERWEVGFPGEPPVARYRFDELRFSVSWKAYCFADEAERRAYHEHSDDLDRDLVLRTFIDDLRRRGRVGSEVPGDRELALLLIDEYIRFPAPGDPGAAAA